MSQQVWRNLAATA